MASPDLGTSPNKRGQISPAEGSHALGRRVCRRPFAGADSVYAYLGRYTHRIGLSNRRLLDVTDERVTFATRDGKSNALPPRLFLRRFLAHGLPPGFVRIRHYGLLACAHIRGELEVVGQALAALDQPARGRPDAADGDELDDPIVELVLVLCGLDLRRCPRCQTPTMRLRARPLPRGPPS